MISLSSSTFPFPLLRFGNTKSSTPSKAVSPEKKSQSPATDIFCRIKNNETPSWTIGETDTTFAILDPFPVTEGHALIIPKRHIGSLFETTAEERDDLFQLLESTKGQIEQACRENNKPLPEGYNIGINNGPTAGQTVPHLHIHLIPRRTGDMDDPTGGVRGVIPERQKYNKKDSPSPVQAHFYQMLQSLTT